MATILDVSLLQSFDVVFVPLLVFAIMFAILQKTAGLTKSVGINAFIAALTAFFVLLSDSAIQIVKFMIPWFTIALVFIILLLLVFQVFGAREEHFLKALLGEKAIIWTILGLGILIFIAALGSVLGQSIGPHLDGETATNTTASGGVATSSFDENVMSTLFHPKVLGFVVIFAIIIMAVFLLTQG